MAPQRYISTRGQTSPLSFQEAVMTGMAPDSGLLLPESVPDVSDRLSAWMDLPYPALAFEVMREFTDLPEADLRRLIEQSYAVFRNPEITPVVPVNGIHVLELFHGPTLAFKDVALQYLGRLFEHILSRSSRCLNILAATSGDTGSAAIHGVRGRKRMAIFVMHPHGRISPTQERQMTTVPDENVFNLAIEGSFDDCQRIMKSIFGELPFKQDFQLGSVNSINWARLLAQIVYYFYAGLRVMRQTGAARVRFSVPTGNFGDIFAGYLALRMGLPIGRLVLATNENDILARFFQTGDYSLGQVHQTISPSMDIQVASNFERYLYYRVGRDPDRLTDLMATFRNTGRLCLPPREDGTIDPHIAAGTADTTATLATIREFWTKHGYLLDPHSAVGVRVARGHLSEDEPMICLATAHPAKFSAAIRDATGQDLAHHEILDALEGLPTRCTVLPDSVAEVKTFIAAHARGTGVPPSSPGR